MGRKTSMIKKGTLRAEGVSRGRNAPVDREEALNASDHYLLGKPSRFTTHIVPSVIEPRLSIPPPIDLGFALYQETNISPGARFTRNIKPTSSVTDGDIGERDTLRDRLPRWVFCLASSMGLRKRSAQRAQRPSSGQSPQFCFRQFNRAHTNVLELDPVLRRCTPYPKRRCQESSP